MTSILKFWLCGLISLSIPLAFGQERYEPKLILDHTLKHNQKLLSLRSELDSYESSTRFMGSMTNPTIGIMRENRSNASGASSVMDAYFFSQEIMFPTKYGLMENLEKSMGEAVHRGLEKETFSVRKDILSLAYEYFSMFKIMEIYEAERQTAREIARIAETRRITGSVPQQDEMKAHVEQSRLEKEFLLAKQEIINLKSKILALMNFPQDAEFAIDTEKFPIPNIILGEKELKKITVSSSRGLLLEAQKVQIAASDYDLAKSRYLPDFMIKATKLNGWDKDDYSVELGISVPLWFYTRQNSLISSKNKLWESAKRNLANEQKKAESDLAILQSQVMTFQKLVSLYNDALIPQATSALNSSQSAYSAGKIGFGDLLDSERTLYMLRIEYFRHVSGLAKSILSLEELIGEKISNLPFVSLPPGGKN